MPQVSYDEARLAHFCLGFLEPSSLVGNLESKIVDATSHDRITPYCMMGYGQIIYILSLALAFIDKSINLQRFCVCVN